MRTFRSSYSYQRSNRVMRVNKPSNHDSVSNIASDKTNYLNLRTSLRVFYIAYNNYLRELDNGDNNVLYYAETNSGDIESQLFLKAENRANAGSQNPLIYKLDAITVDSLSDSLKRSERIKKQDEFRKLGVRLKRKYRGNTKAMYFDPLIIKSGVGRYMRNYRRKVLLSISKNRRA